MQSKYFGKQLLPAGQRFVGGDPHARRHPHDQRAQIFEHENVEIRLPIQTIGRALDEVGVGAVRVANAPVPADHPVVEVHLLVDEAHDHSHSRKGI